MNINNLIGVLMKWSLILLTTTAKIVPTSNKCRLDDFFQSLFQCDKIEYSNSQINICNEFHTDKVSPTFFLFYDVNSSEGFNLRRDVYIRLVVFVKWLRKQAGYENVVLVLPPFYQLYHWRLPSPRLFDEHNNINDDVVFWNHFFDMQSLKRYTSVIDMWEFFDEMRVCIHMQKKNNYSLDRVFQLKHFQSMFQSGKFEEKFQIHKKCPLQRSKNHFLNIYRNFSTHRIECLEFQGTAKLLRDLLDVYRKEWLGQTYTVALLNAETVLHDRWGGAEFWKARRSMRFNEYLVNTAQTFRSTVLNSTDQNDATQRPKDWRLEVVRLLTKTESRQAIGGNYLCAHLRRADFLHGREETTPTLRSAASQISAKLKTLKLRTVFVSSDCTGQEYHSLKSYLQRFRVVKFTPSSSAEREQLKPGGIAIIDQIVCSHARYFIGTYESTFTYRIYEEREILGFPQESTFNTFCKTHTDTQTCAKNSVWPIVF